MLFIYPIGIPLTYFMLLRQHRYTLSDADAIAREAKEGFPTIGHLIFLVEAYKPKYYFYEVIEVIRRLLLASVLGMIDADSAASPTVGIFDLLRLPVCVHRLQAIQKSQRLQLGHHIAVLRHLDLSFSTPHQGGRNFGQC